MPDLTTLRAGDSYTVRITGNYRLVKLPDGELALQQELMRMDNGDTEWHTKPTIEAQS